MEIEDQIGSIEELEKNLNLCDIYVTQVYYVTAFGQYFIEKMHAERLSLDLHTVLQNKTAI